MDAVSYLDKVCSGRELCKYVAVDTDLGATDPCPGLANYLEIDYTCITGKLSLTSDSNFSFCVLRKPHSLSMETDYRAYNTSNPNINCESMMHLHL